MDDQASGCGKRGVIFPLLRLNPSRYTTAKLNERELCTVHGGLDPRCSRALSTTYGNDYSSDYRRLCQYPDPIRIECLDEECNLMGY